jgi:hypothetical protein
MLELGGFEGVRIVRFRVSGERVVGAANVPAAPWQSGDVRLKPFSGFCRV